MSTVLLVQSHLHPHGDAAAHLTVVVVVVVVVVGGGGPEEQARNRFQSELEFIQCLANPNYLNCEFT